MLKGRIKELVFKIHLWLGIVTAIPILILSLTGAILVFQDEIENLVNSEVIKLEMPSADVDLNAIIENFKNSYPLNPGRISIPSQEDLAVRVFAMDRKKGERVDAYFDRTSGREVGRKNKLIQSFFSFNLRLHRGMIAGDFGQFILTYSTAILLLLLISGFILWLPSKIKIIKKSLQINFKARLKALLYQLHTTVGVFSLIFLLLIAFSGFYMGDNNFRNLVQLSLGGEVKERSGHSHNHGNQGRQSTRENKGKIKKDIQSIDYNYYLKSVKNQLDYDATLLLAFGRRAGDPLRITAIKNTAFAPERTTFTFKGRRLLKAESSSDLNTADFYRSINRSVHTGEYFGPFGKWLFLLSCLACASLVITGVWLWLSKKRKKRVNVLS